MASTYFGLTFPDLGKINGQLFYCVGQGTRKTKTNVQINGSSAAPKSHENIRSESKLDFFLFHVFNPFFQTYYCSFYLTLLTVFFIYDDNLPLMSFWNIQRFKASLSMYIIIVMFRLIIYIKSLFHIRKRKLKKKIFRCQRFDWNNFSLKINT